MSVRWSEEALGAYEFLAVADGFEDAYQHVAAQVRHLEENPGAHRTGAEQRWIAGVALWFIVLGDPGEEWLMSWTAQAGVIVVQSLDPLDPLGTPPEML